MRIADISIETQIKKEEFSTKQKLIISVVFGLFLLIGLGLIVYPIFSNLFSEQCTVRCSGAVYR